MNTDYRAEGIVTGNKIVFRPDVGVLDAWPAWTPAPNRDDVLNCSVELTLVHREKPQELEPGAELTISHD